MLYPLHPDDGVAEAVEVDQVLGLPTQRHQHSLHVARGLGLGLASQEDVEVGEQLGVWLSKVEAGVALLPLSLERGREG